MPKTAAAGLGTLTAGQEPSKGRELQSKERADKSRVPELDGLRAIAILLVMGCHYPAFASMLGGTLKFGWVGVEIFFVLSGYLITTVVLDLKGSKGAMAAFYKRRTVRIFPPYFALLAIMSLIAYFGTSLPHHFIRKYVLIHTVFGESWMNARTHLSHVLSAVKHWTPPALFAVHSLPPAPDGFGPANAIDSLLHFWSLSVEEWYYVLWAPIILRLPRKASYVMIFLLSAACFMMRWLGFINWQWYGSILCRLDTIIFGSALALWFKKRGTLPIVLRSRADRAVSLSGFLGVGLLVALLVHIGPIRNHEIRASVCFAAFGPILIGVIVAAGLAYVLRNSRQHTIATTVLRNRVLVYVGRRSYVMYLVHIPVFSGICLLMSRTSFATAITSSSLTLGLAALSWRYFEEPLLTRKPKTHVRTLVR